MRYATYIRVSTKKQGKTQLGLDAQRKMCSDYISQKGGVLEREFSDVESGTHRDRPGLWAALDYCKVQNCALVIAKLDRLARDVEFTFKVINTGVQIFFVDMPIMNTMLLGVFASVAQYEREMCSSRTKAALDEIKEDIAENGGHISKTGRWVKGLGREKGTKVPGAGVSAGVSHTRRANDWRSTSSLYKWVARQVKQHRPRKEILEEAQALYEETPSVFCTRGGKPLCKGTLSRWVKEISITI